MKLWAGLCCRSWNKNSNLSVALILDLGDATAVPTSEHLHHHHHHHPLPIHKKKTLLSAPCNPTLTTQASKANPSRANSSDASQPDKFPPKARQRGKRGEKKTSGKQIDRCCGLSRGLVQVEGDARRERGVHRALRGGRGES